MRRVFALLLALFLFVPAAASSLPAADGVGVEPVEASVDLPADDLVDLPEPDRPSFLDSGPIPVVIVEPEPDAVAYAVGTVGPAGGYYLQVSSSALGVCTVWLPFEYVNDSFSWYGGRLVSLRSGSVSGIVVTGSTVYNLRFSSFLSGAQYYRSSGGSYYWTDLNITALDGGNIEVLEDSPGYQIDIPILILVVVIIIVGVRLLGLSR